MQKELEINDLAVSSWESFRGCVTGYKNIQGSAGGTMLDGSTTLDIIATKATLAVSLMPRVEAEIQQLVSSIFSNDYAKIRFFDIRQNEYRTAEFMYNDMQVTHLTTLVGERDFWKLATLEFTER